VTSYRTHGRKVDGNEKRNGSRWRRRRNTKVWYSDSDGIDERDRNRYINRAISKSLGNVLWKKTKQSNEEEITMSVSVYAKPSGLTELNNDPIVEKSPQSTLTSNISSSEIKRNHSNKETNVVRNVHDLRKAILHNGYKLEEIELDSIYAEAKNANLKDDSRLMSSPGNHVNVTNDLDLGHVLDHKVLELIKNRVVNNSKPGNRAKNDTSILALSIEGGGMRGSVSAGMASAIATLGLCDAFDSIYGSSAGSVVGAYMISRQMCVDVYTDLLPVARKIFVSKLRLVSSLIVSVVDNLLTSTSLRNFDLISRQTPAMNISFVLDGIMDPHTGLRPLDLKAFQTNDLKQSLRVVSSAVRDGKMETVCFGSKEGDFFSNGDNHNDVTISVDRKSRRGLFACLEASMTVPGATGPPINLKQRSTNPHTSGNNKEEASISACFDAFCFEPLPYRSAVE